MEKEIRKMRSMDMCKGGKEERSGVKGRCHGKRREENAVCKNLHWRRAEK